MKTRRLKKSVVYGLYAVSLFAFFGVIYLIESNIGNRNLKNNNIDYTYVSKTIFDDTVNVVANEAKIIKPYTDPDLKVLQKYYNYKDAESEQQKSIIYYQNTYMQSTGISYGGKDDFDVVSILDGTVISVKTDNIVGTTVEIKHSDDVISVYQSLDNVIVKENEVVTRGQVIGKGGTSNINKDLGNHVYFEIVVKGNTINPEDCYNKSLSEL